MIAAAIIICGLYLVIKGDTFIYGGRVAEGKPVRLFGLVLIGLSVLSLVLTGTLAWVILGVDIVSIVIFYIFAKGRKATEEEQKDNIFSSKEDEKGAVKVFGKAVVILAIAFVVLLGGVFVLLLILKRVS